MPAAPPGPDRVLPSGGRSRTILWTLRAAQVRLRFLAVIAVAGLVVGKWDVLRSYWDRWTGPSARDASMGAVSANTEYFCPMDPGVLSDWPGKCSVCNMALVRRAKGDMSPMPNGVVARVQLSPDRVMLAGIRTAPAAFRTIEQVIDISGAIAEENGTRHLLAEITPADGAWLRPGLSATMDVAPSEPSVPGKVVSVGKGPEGTARVTVLPSETSSDLIPGRIVSARIRVPIADREPFRSTPSGTPTLRKEEPRVAYVCPDHPDVVRAAAAKCPKDGNTLEREPLGSDQRIDWWCPMHPKVTAERAGSSCAECGGMVLVPRVVTYRPAGTVLSVPEAAVIDTGTRKVVFVETMPGMFDGVEVTLGPKCGGYYAVISGLAPGQRVATAGAFLLDAETRLNPSLAAGYFGANRGASTPTAKAAAPVEALDFTGLSATDRALAEKQKLCPVTGKPLGSMGPPFKCSIRGRSVFVCCDGCEGLMQDSPDKYLSRLPREAKARP